jgi:hypothetical protein
LFYATGGRNINTAEFFQADTLKSREAEIKAMEDKKKERQAYLIVQKAAREILIKKGDVTFSNHKKFKIEDLKVLLKWKRVKVKSSKKEDLVEAYVAAPKPLKPTKVWCNSEEKALLTLKEPQMDLKDTALGVVTSQMARAVTHNVATLPSPERVALQKSLEDYDATKKEMSGII